MNRPTDPDGGDARPTLQRPPGERYRPTPPPGDQPSPPTLARSLALAGLGALAGSAAIVVLGGVFSMTAGLLVVAGIIGFGIGRVMAPAPGTARLRGLLAAVLAVDAIVLGQVGLWLFAISQGGSLGLLEYVAQARGPLAAVEVAVAAVVAWWFAR